MSNKIWLTDTDMAERRGTGRVTVWRHAQQGLIPRPHKIGPGTSRWYLPEVEAHERRQLEADKRGAA